MMNLVDVLSITGHVDSTVALSEKTPFQPKFSSVYDALQHGEVNIDHLPEKEGDAQKIIIRYPESAIKW